MKLYDVEQSVQEEIGKDVDLKTDNKPMPKGVSKSSKPISDKFSDWK
jgi:hypothetical protein